MLKTMVTMALTACLAIAAQARSAPPDRPPGQTAEQYYALNVEKNTAPTDQLAAAQITPITAPQDNLATPIRTNVPSSMRADSGPPIAPMERSAQVTRYRLNKMNDQVISKVNRWTWAGRTQMVRRLRC